MKKEANPIAQCACCACEEIRLPQIPLAQWVDCAHCGRRPTWDSFQEAWRCPLDGRVEPAQGCSGSGI